MVALKISAPAVFLCSLPNGKFPNGKFPSGTLSSEDSHRKRVPGNAYVPSFAACVLYPLVLTNHPNRESGPGSPAARTLLLCNGSSDKIVGVILISTEVLAFP